MNSKPCTICGEPATLGDKCAEHAPKWQRRFFYPCRYCGGHVKSYKAKRCGRRECLARAGREASLLRYGPGKKVKPHFYYDHGGAIDTRTGWARKLGISPALIFHHLSRGKTIAEIVERFTKKGGKKNAG